MGDQAIGWKGNAGKTQNCLDCVYEEDSGSVSFDRKCVAAHAIT